MQANNPTRAAKIQNIPSEHNSETDLFGVPLEICTVEKDPTRSGLEAMRDRSFRRYCKKHGALIHNIDNVGLPKTGEQIRLITKRTFNAIQFLEYITERERITDLKMAIYSINYNAALILIDLIDRGLIAQVEILMSNLRNKAHREKEEILRQLFIDHPKIDIFYCSSHAKTFSCATDAGNYYTLEGSGNLAYNSRVEQYVIDNDRDLYEFSCQWMREIREFLQDKKEFEDPSRSCA